VSDFPNSTPKIDDLVEAYTTGQGADFERLKEALKGHMADANPPVSPALRVALPANQQAPTHYRVIYPHLNDRVTLYGSSEQELDEKERHLREMYGGTR
jgi:hypothetical protein